MEAKKSLGQHWLSDEATLNAMCDAANVKKGDTVLEIGPGQGSLTAKLLERGTKVVGVELDEALTANLKKRFAGQPFILNMLSILDFDLSKMPKSYKIVANIPYYLTAHLLRMLCESHHQPSMVVLLVQKEVAVRITALPGNLSVLALLVQFYFEPKLGRVVPAKLFTPPPKVDSQILILKRRQKPLFTDLDAKQFFRLVKAGFSARRKKLKSSLSGGLGISKIEAETLLRSANISSDVRAQELTIEQWYKLYQKFSVRT